MDTRNIAVAVLVTFIPLSLTAQASIYLTPDGTGDGSTLAMARGQGWDGTSPGNPKADDIETITGFAGELFELYKQDVDPFVESGSFSGSYSTDFFNSPTDPEDSTISYDSGSKILNAEYLLVKDGVNHTPVWYIFDISDWDGMMDLVMTDFWPNQGAISHVSIYGTDLPPIDPGGNPDIPEPTSALVWSLLSLACVGVVRRRNLD